MKRLFRVSLLYPAVNPLPSETLPFPFPDILTDRHAQTNANAQSIDNNCEHTPTHTLRTSDTFCILLHVSNMFVRRYMLCIRWGFHDGCMYCLGYFLTLPFLYSYIFIKSQQILYD